MTGFQMNTDYCLIVPVTLSHNKQVNQQTVQCTDADVNAHTTPASIPPPHHPPPPQLIKIFYKWASLPDHCLSCPSPVRSWWSS